MTITGAREHPTKLATAALIALLLAGCSSGSHPKRASTAAQLAPAPDCAQLLPEAAALAASARERLRTACASRSGQAVRTAVKEVCEEVVGASTLPAGTAREQALKTCRRP